MNQFVFEDKRPIVETKQGKLRGVTYGDDELCDLHFQYAPKFVPPFTKKK